MKKLLLLLVALIQISCGADPIQSVIPHSTSKLKALLVSHLQLQGQLQKKEEWIGSSSKPGHTFIVFEDEKGNSIEIDSMSGDLENVFVVSASKKNKPILDVKHASATLKKFMPKFQFNSVVLTRKPSIVDGVAIDQDRYHFFFSFEKGGIDWLNTADVTFNSHGDIRRMMWVKMRGDNLYHRPKNAKGTVFLMEDTWMLPYFTDAASKSHSAMNLRNGPQVKFNGDSVDFLVFPPHLQQNQPLIFADYFPQFLIDLQRDGAKITLKGQLPEKGKEVVLELGKREATVDGKPVTLSVAPQEIEGRLYLPYELLTLCNGVLTRWDAKKNTLWVDTRFLRRPD